MNIPCKFYLQGRCKYESRCRFLHEDYSHRSHGDRTHHKGDGYYEYTDQDKYRPGNTRYTVDNRQKGYENTSRYETTNRYENERHNRRPNSRYNNNTHHGNSTSRANTITQNEIFTVLREELIEREKSGIWPLTSFGLSADYGNVPGFTDVSPEEIRHEFYSAMKNGSLQEFYGKWNSSLEQVKNLINAFRHGKEEAKQIAAMVHNGAQKGEDAITEPFSPFSSTPIEPMASSDSTSWPHSTSGFNSQQTSSSQMNSFSFAKPSENNFSSFPASGNVFGTMAPQQTFGAFTQPQSFAMPGNPAFAQQPEFADMAPQQPFFTQSSSQQSMDTSNSIYSLVDEDKYQSSTFVLGSVPLNPPPKKLC